MADGTIQVFNGAASDMVTTETNQTGRMDPILAVSPSRGNMIRILNKVMRGDQMGVPVSMDLRDANGDPLPVDTTLQWEYSPSNSDSRFKISRQISNLGFYQNTDFALQTSDDYIDQSKQILTQPEFEGSAPVEFIQITDIEDLYLSADSSAQIDWSQSKIEVEPNAIKGPFNRGR